MAKAVRSLSAKQIYERLQLHRQAVMVLARRAAIKATKAKLRSQGVRLTCVLPKDINVLARDYLAQHRDELIAEAEHAIATWPGFVRCSRNQSLRLCRTHAQKESNKRPAGRHQQGNMVRLNRATDLRIREAQI